MGQQQLLLLVFGVLIIGIALLTGIDAFSAGKVRSNSDALLQDAVRIALEAQVWKSKPELLGGSPDVTKKNAGDYSKLTYYELGLAAENIVDQDCYVDQNGEFALFPDNAGLGILGSNVANQNMVGVLVTGSDGNDVQLYVADWNPVKGGYKPDGSAVKVQSHQRCRGKGQTPIKASG